MEAAVSESLWLCCCFSDIVVQSEGPFQKPHKSEAQNPNIMARIKH